MSKEHTPTPWRIVTGEQNEPYPGIDASKYSIIVFGDDDDDGGVRGKSREQASANAEFIVRAVNAHDELVDALKAHDVYMLDAGYVGPDSEALHPKAAENWRRVRSAIAKVEARS